jgi:carbamoyltransferase
MTAILGLSAFYHDSAAALVVDGRLVAAAQEERFTRIKHDAEFPRQAVTYCLGAAGLTASQLDYVAFYDKPLLKFDRLLETYLAFAPRGLRSFFQAMPQWLQGKLNLRRTLRKELGIGKQPPILFLEHHESHAASAFFPSPFEEAAILTLDGVGEWASASLGVGRGREIQITHEQHFPHSLGLLYTAFTYYCGFKVNSGEYKLMGLAPYGEPRFADLIRVHLVEVRPDGSLRLDQSYFNYCTGLTMTSERFHRLFGGPPRKPESPIEQRHMDLAASIQVVTEEIVLNAARHVHAQTGLTNLCLAGGVALNCVATGRLLREGPYKQIWVQPAAGDAGGALGSALFVWHQLLEKPRTPGVPDGQCGSLLGPEYSPDEIAAVLQDVGAVYERAQDEAELCDRVAKLLAAGQVVGWFQGRMEFGPRALGARSILGDPRDTDMQSRMNLKIKLRESFRPFAPIVLAEAVQEHFEFPPGHDSPYMLIVAPVKNPASRTLGPSGTRSAASGASRRGFDRLKDPRPPIPAVTHVDWSARLQTVDAVRNPRLHRLLQAFRDQTGCPVLVNTSFNVRGEPIVCTPRQAWDCFAATEIDALVMGDFVLLKSQQSVATTDNREAHLAKFGLD